MRASVCYNRSMEEDLVTRALANYSMMNQEQKEHFMHRLLLLSENTDESEASQIDVRFSSERICPHCGMSGKGVIKNGHFKNGNQRFRCQHCCRAFTVRTKTVYARTRKTTAVWKKFISCMMQAKTIRESAAICGIAKNTAFAWRHKVLDALQKMMEAVNMDGEVEADETFFRLSYKGNHKNSKTFCLPRKAHKRGNDTHTRGLSREQVCVPCAVNKEGLSIARATNLGRANKVVISNLYTGHIKAGSVLCTDSSNAYALFAKQSDLKHVKISSGKRVNGRHGIQRINNYHSRLKQFIDRFNGVSTKYLNNYLVWHNFVNISREHKMAKEQTLFNFLLRTINTTLSVSLSQRPSIPFSA